MSNYTIITTNSTKDSIFEVEIKKIKFKDLWNSFPSDNIKHKTNAIDNFCAINLSESLAANGITFKSFTGAKCWGCPTKNGRHIIRAQEFATWLKKRPFAGCPKAEKYTGENYEENIDGKTGIIFFKDYWQRANEKGTKNRSGDHIDLWDGKGLNKLAGYNMAQNFITNTLGIYVDGWYSDKKLSKSVLFWEIN